MCQLRSFVLLVIPILLLACGNGAGNKGNTPIVAVPDPLREISADQQAALDVLNVLQQNSDTPNRIYSTFPNITQPCYPPDSTFVISQSDFRLAMTLFVEKNFTRLDQAYRDSLARTAVLAQEEYKVLHCRDTARNKYAAFKYPTTGRWVIPNVLERRDVLIVW